MSRLLCFVAFALAACSASADHYTSERDLRQDIFKGYDKLVRPVKSAATPVPVAMSVTPLSLKSMSEKDQIMVLDTWVMMKWTDEFLKWDPSEYGNITELRVSPTEIWKPDLALYTATPDKSLFPTVDTQAIVFNNGMMLWVPPFTLQSRCPIPYRNMAVPRTFVECNVRFGSWTYSGKLMDIQLSTEQVDLTNFQDFNPEWKLVKIVQNRESKFYPCCVEDYPLINFNVTLKRRNYYN